ncbi:DUF2553 family protein [Pontibacillus salipaludis]|uniref:DUF2553 family protein n=1 Tax=Pontibacillus salipaludis TaxID=1697394 RepID=UPI0031EDF8C9
MKKVEITERVVGKVNGDGFELFLNKDRIGEISFRNNKKEYLLQSGFVAEGHRIYKVEEAGEPVTQFVHDCDLGWC